VWANDAARLEVDDVRVGVAFPLGELDRGGQVHLVRSLSDPFGNARAEPKDLHRPIVSSAQRHHDRMRERDLARRAARSSTADPTVTLIRFLGGSAKLEADVRDGRNPPVRVAAGLTRKAIAALTNHREIRLPLQPDRLAT